MGIPDNEKLRHAEAVLNGAIAHHLKIAVETHEFVVNPPTPYMQRHRSILAEAFKANGDAAIELAKMNLVVAD